MIYVTVEFGGEVLVPGSVQMRVVEGWRWQTHTPENITFANPLTKVTNKSLVLENYVLFGNVGNDEILA